MSFVGSAGSPGSTHSSRTPLPLVSSTSGLQPCAASSSPVSRNRLVSSHPMTWPAAARPQGVLVVLGEDQMVGAVAGADEGHLVGRGVVHREMPVRPGVGEHAGRRMVGPLQAHRRVLGGPRTRDVSQTRPSWSSMGLCTLVWLSPDGLVAPVGRGTPGAAPPRPACRGRAPAPRPRRWRWRPGRAPARSRRWPRARRRIGP